MAREQKDIEEALLDEMAREDLTNNELRRSLNAETGGSRALSCNHWFLVLGLFVFPTAVY